MNKVRISEQRLEKLIFESIQEVIEEDGIDEGLGRWLGNKYQSIRNGLRNFRQDFRAGRGEARAENLRRNPYDQFPEEQRALIAFLSNGNNYSEARKKIIHDLFQKYMTEVQNNPEYSDFLPQRGNANTNQNTRNQGTDEFSNATNSRLYDQDMYNDRRPYFNQSTTYDVNPMGNPDISQPVNRNNGQEETGASKPKRKKPKRNPSTVTPKPNRSSKTTKKTVKPATVTAKSNRKSKTGKTSKNTSFTSNDINQPQQFSIFDKRWKDNPHIDGNGE